MKKIAIACASGSFKGAFVHGVLTALESAGIRANAYAAASSSVITTAWATIGKAKELGVEYWLTGMSLLKQENIGMSKIALGGIKNFSPPKLELFAKGTPEYLIAASAVITQAAASETQSEKARRMGRKLLISAAKKDRSWVNEHLQLHLFSTCHDRDSELHLNADNFEEVAYASTRMLHAWEVPAWIANKPYIDASYTCICPAIEMIEAGYKEVIAISNEPGIFYRDMFQLEEIPSNYQDTKIHVIRPDVDTRELGVDFTDATKEGLVAVYQHGIKKGEQFCKAI
ncbi:MAG: hypothetical protein HC903_14400 [Methylacidiphilales bacterium]|nr:hypothetical protein [Candidatus Methylacidiphilales bacterium]